VEQSPTKKSITLSLVLLVLQGTLLLSACTSVGIIRSSTLRIGIVVVVVAWDSVGLHGLQSNQSIRIPSLMKLSFCSINNGWIRVYAALPVIRNLTTTQVLFVLVHVLEVVKVGLVVVVIIVD
jgi:hypothetical protein